MEAVEAIGSRGLGPVLLPTCVNPLRASGAFPSRKEELDSTWVQGEVLKVSGVGLRAWGGFSDIGF